MRWRQNRLSFSSHLRARPLCPPRDLGGLVRRRTGEVEQRTGKWMTSEREAAVVTLEPDSILGVLLSFGQHPNLGNHTTLGLRAFRALRLLEQGGRLGKTEVLLAHREPFSVLLCSEMIMYNILPSPSFNEMEMRCIHHFISLRYTAS